MPIPQPPIAFGPGDFLLCRRCGSVPLSILLYRAYRASTSTRQGRACEDRYAVCEDRRGICENKSCSHRQHQAIKLSTLSLANSSSSNIVSKWVCSSKPV